MENVFPMLAFLYILLKQITISRADARDDIQPLGG